MSRKRPKRRLRRVVLALCVVALVVAVLWLGVTRWNGVPADTSGVTLDRMPSKIPIDPAIDRTKELLAALQSLPAEPTWTLPDPPKGMRWAGQPTGLLEPYEIVDGEWTPKTRPHMQAVIRHLNTPGVETALERFARIPAGGCRLSSGAASNLRRVGKLLGARARYQHAGLGNVDSAIDSLLTLMHLTGVWGNSRCYIIAMTGSGCEQLAMQEIRCMSFERDLTREQSDRISEAIRGVRPTEDELWRNLARFETDTTTDVLNLAYTLEDDGNGWLVLSSLDGMLWGARPAGNGRSGVWNLLSPLYNDRRTVSAKIERIRSTYEKAARLPYAEARRKMSEMEANLEINILDGPLGQASLARFATSRHRWLINRVACRGATVVAAALSAYRRDHGKYPTALAELTDQYLQTIPLDPFDEQPIRYRLQDSGNDFVLYCVGPNQIDDDGKPPERRVGKPRSEEGDKVFTHTRRTNLWSEIELEEVRP